MNKNKLIQKFYKINQELYRKARRSLPSHGPEHHRRVLLNALKIAKGFKDVDFDILVPACLLHDLGSYYPKRAGRNFHEEDRIRAENLFKTVDFPKDKKQMIIEAIANHGSDPKYKSAKEPVETTILRDADKLEAFGSLGVARIIMARSLNGNSLRDIVKKYYTDGALRQKWKSITTIDARKMGKDDYEFSLNFFAKLAKQLGHE